MNTKKKIIALVAVLVIAAVAVGGYFVFIKPSSEVGNKTVSISITANNKTLEKEYKTDKEYLEGLLVEKQKELGVTLTDSTYGKFVAGMNNYMADTNKQEFFEVLVNDVPAMYGISEIPLKDGEKYSFRISTY